MFTTIATLPVNIFKALSDGMVDSLPSYQMVLGLPDDLLEQLVNEVAAFSMATGQWHPREKPMIGARIHPFWRPVGRCLVEDDPDNGTFLKGSTA